MKRQAKATQRSRDDQVVGGRVTRVHEEEDDAVEEDEAAELVPDGDGLGELRHSMLGGDRVEDEVPCEGGDGTHPEEAVHQRPQTHCETCAVAGEEEGGKEEGVLEDEEEAGRLGKGTPCG